MGKDRIKRYVILDTGAIIDLESWGLHWWGSTEQEGIKVKNNKVYATYWSWGGEWEDDTNEETLLGTIVYSSDKPFHIEEANSAILTTKRPEYSEYGIDLDTLFNTNQENIMEDK